MTRITKNRKLSLEKYDTEKIYSISEASKIVEISTTKFDASVDLDVRLGVDPKKADQMVRGYLYLTEQVKRLGTALCSADKEEEAKKAGADHVGLKNTLKLMKVGLMLMLSTLNLP